MVFDLIPALDGQAVRVMAMTAGGDIALSASDAPVILDATGARRLIDALAAAAGLGAVLFPASNVDEDTARRLRNAL